MKKTPLSFLPKAVVFDFDGVIADTEPLHYAAFTEVLSPEGLAFSREAYDAYYMGFDDRDAVDTAARARGKTLEVQTRKRLLQEKVDAFSRLARNTPLVPLPGVAALLQSLAESQIPVALCSGALRRDIQPILEQMALTRFFEVQVTADDVAHSKPDPASYRLVHERLCVRLDKRIPPEQCLAIEDTAAGIESARRAGFRVLAVAGSGSSSNMSKADGVVSTLDKLTSNSLSRFMS